MRAVSSYYGGLMNIATGPQRHRMLRRGDWKLCAYDGYQPQLFDLSEDPDELRDMAGDQTEIVADMMHELTMGWDVKVIARAQHQAEERNHLIRSWVKATKPEERLRWRDPAPTRNRYL
jgi:choline-sulfatase